MTWQPNNRVLQWLLTRWRNWRRAKYLLDYGDATFTRNSEAAHGDGWVRPGVRRIYEDGSVLVTGGQANQGRDR